MVVPWRGGWVSAHTRRSLGGLSGAGWPSRPPRRPWRPPRQEGRTSTGQAQAQAQAGTGRGITRSHLDDVEVVPLGHRLPVLRLCARGPLEADARVLRGVVVCRRRRRGGCGQEGGVGVRGLEVCARALCAGGGGVRVLAYGPAVQAACEPLRPPARLPAALAAAARSTSQAHPWR